MQNRPPGSVTNLGWGNSFASIHSKGNPNVLFNMCGSEIRILPKTLTFQEEFTRREGVWMLQDGATKEMTSHALLKVGDETHGQFKDRCRAILMASGSMPLTKIAEKLNTDLVGILPRRGEPRRRAAGPARHGQECERRLGLCCAAPGEQGGGLSLFQKDFCLSIPPPLPPRAWRPWP